MNRNFSRDFLEIVKWYERWLQWPPALLDGMIIIASVLACTILMSAHFPGTRISGVGVNWLLIWVVSWSLKRTIWEGIVAGVALGLIADSLSFPYPTHAISFAVVGACTALLQKQRYIQEDFISVALIVFGMAVIAETIFAMQFSLTTDIQDWLPNLTSPLSNQDALLAETAPLAQAVDSSLVDRVGMTLPEIWSYHQRVALSSAIVSSLWAPIVYYPLNRWWQWLEAVKTP